MKRIILLGIAVLSLVVACQGNTNSTSTSNSPSSNTQTSHDTSSMIETLSTNSNTSSN